PDIRQLLLSGIAFQKCLLRSDLSRVNSAKCSKPVNAFTSTNNRGLLPNTIAPQSVEIPGS
ncbi:MAG: hypothetical protein NC489_43890, partial [Ruminococcus flavefaciens]|nr:hypothetical protein [Ruminococcus flavefaciens]